MLLQTSCFINYSCLVAMRPRFFLTVKSCMGHSVIFCLNVRCNARVSKHFGSLSPLYKIKFSDCLSACNPISNIRINVLNVYDIIAYNETVVLYS